MIKANDIVEVQGSNFSILNNRKGIVTQTFPELKAAVVQFAVAVKHFEASDNTSYQYNTWFLPYKHLKTHVGVDSAMVEVLTGHLTRTTQQLEVAALVIEEQQEIIQNLFNRIEELKKEIDD